MLYVCYMKLKDLPSLKMISAMSVHLTTGHDLCSIGLACCEVMIGKTQFINLFNVCKRLQKELVIGLDI